MFKEYVEVCEAERRKKLGDKAVFPCLLEIVEVFRKSKPVVLGVHVKSGILKIGSPICVPDAENLKIGKVASI